MLPQKYMNGVSGYHPNALYKAVLEKTTEKVTEKLENTQYLTVKQFAEKYGMDANIAEREWESLWIIVSGGNAYSRIPQPLQMHFTAGLPVHTPHINIARRLQRVNWGFKSCGVQWCCRCI